MKLSEFFTNVLKVDLNKDLPSSTAEPNNQNNTNNSGAGQSAVNILQQQQTQPQQQPQQQPQTQPQQQQQTQPQQQPDYDSLIKQIEELKQANNALLNNVSVEKPPTFDECIYNIYNESRGIFDGRDNNNNSK